MTIAEMHVAVKLGLDKSSSLELPAFEPEEIDYWINKAVDQFVDSEYKIFEQTQLVTESLKKLIYEDMFDTIAGSYGASNKANCYTADIYSPDIYRYGIAEEVNIYYLDPISNEYVTKRQGVTDCSQINYRSFLDNPFSEHRLHYGEAKPLRLFVNNYVELVSDGNYSVPNYVLVYIRNPEKVSLSGGVNCELSAQTHNKIVDITVSLLLENIESARAQGFEQRRMIQG